MRDISIEEALKGNYVFVDVRSESEFAESTIPGAINLPLLNDQERVKVGTIYKQVSEAEAKFVGLEIVSHKLPRIMEELKQLIKSQQKVVLFCWRGGMRSKSMAVLAGFLGLSVCRLLGGYKAYRKHVNNYFENLANLPLIVIHGNTGVGKTDLIQLLQAQNYPTIDLEGLANNRGSAFGDINMPPQPSQKMFESLLFNELKRFEQAPAILIECESKRIGRIVVPELFFQQMQAGRHILVYGSEGERVKRLVDIYGGSKQGQDEKITAAILSLKKRLGTKKVDELLDLVNRGALDAAALVLLTEYYDPLYGYPNEPSDKYEFSIKTDNLEDAMEELIIKLNLRR